MPTAELGPRQIWWVTTVVSASAAIALLVYARSAWVVAAALVLLAAPHIVGAPQPPSYETPIPEGLHQSFIVAVVLTTLVFWVLLGGLAGYFRERFIAPA
jgi:cobalt transporter subunit CbtA